MAAPGDGGRIEVTQGGAGPLGRGTVGLDWVSTDGHSARVSLGGMAGGTHWSTRAEVREGSVLSTSGDAYKVVAIVAAKGGKRGEVSFAPATGAAAADAVPLTAAAPLMLGGPEIEQMTTLRLVSITAGAAEVEWWPALYAREDADPKTVQRARVIPGAGFAIGPTQMKIATIQPATPDQPASLTIIVSPAS